MYTMSRSFTINFALGKNWVAKTPDKLDEFNNFCILPNVCLIRMYQFIFLVKKPRKRSKLKP